MTRLTTVAACLASALITACTANGGSGSQTGAPGPDSKPSEDVTQADVTPSDTATDVPGADAEGEDTAPVCPNPSYANAVRPVLTQYCQQCHGKNAWMNTCSSAKKEINAVVYYLDHGMMPPPTPKNVPAYPVPTEEQKAILKAWADSGAACATPQCP
jgi:hypothetical protein